MDTLTLDLTAKLDADIKLKLKINILYIDLKTIRHYNWPEDAFVLDCLSRQYSNHHTGSS